MGTAEEGAEAGAEAAEAEVQSRLSAAQAAAPAEVARLIAAGASVDDPCANPKDAPMLPGDPEAARAQLRTDTPLMRAARADRLAARESAAVEARAASSILTMSNFPHTIASASGGKPL